MIPKISCSKFKQNDWMKKNNFQSYHICVNLRVHLEKNRNFMQINNMFWAYFRAYETDIYALKSRNGLLLFVSQEKFKWMFYYRKEMSIFSLIICVSIIPRNKWEIVMGVWNANSHSRIADCVNKRKKQKANPAWMIQLVFIVWLRLSSLTHRFSLATDFHSAKEKQCVADALRMICWFSFSFWLKICFDFEI